MKNIISKNEPFYQISQVAKILGITTDRLRTYEEEGLIKPAREKGGKRLFTLEEIEWLEILREVIKLGVTIPTIRILLISKLPNNCDFLRDKDAEILKLIKKLNLHPVIKKIAEKTNSKNTEI